MRLGSLRDVGAVAALRPEWEALFVTTAASVFNSWEWQYCWLSRLAPDRRPWVLTARDGDGRLVGLLPLGWEERRVLGRRVRRLSFLGESLVGSDYLDVLAAPGLEAPVVRLFARALEEAHAAWDVLDLVDLPSDSPTVALLSGALGAPGYLARVTERYVCPYERFSPAESFDQLLARTTRRDNYLRRRKWLERQPGFRIERTEGGPRLPMALGELFRLHRLRWMEDGGSQGIHGPHVEAFHRDVSQRLAERRRLRLYTLFVQGEAVASVYGILQRSTFLYYQSGYDPAWRAKSVGLVLVGETFKDSLGEGLTEYDFLRGTESYKADWTTRRRKTVALRIIRAAGPGAWLERAEEWDRRTRDAARAALPRRLVERIQRERRRAGGDATQR